MAELRAPSPNYSAYQNGSASRGNTKEKREPDEEGDEVDVSNGSECRTPSGNEEPEREPLFSVINLPHETCAREVDSLDVPEVEFVKTAVLPKLQQALLELLRVAYESGDLQQSLQNLYRARRAALERKDSARSHQTDTADDSNQVEQALAELEEEEREPTPGGFQPLLVLAGILQRIAGKKQEEAPEEPATAVTATEAERQEKTAEQTLGSDRSDVLENPQEVF